MTISNLSSYSELTFQTSGGTGSKKKKNIEWYPYDRILQVRASKSVSGFHSPIINLSLRVDNSCFCGTSSPAY